MNVEDKNATPQIWISQNFALKLEQSYIIFTTIKRRDEHKLAHELNQFFPMIYMIHMYVIEMNCNMATD